MSRLVAVLGYSNGSGSGLHPVCAHRLARGEEVVEPGDVVLLSGWARRGSPAPEAELMAQVWTTPVRTVLLDRGARTTVGNLIGVARAARAAGVDEVVLVTSAWHAGRARLLARAALLGTGTRLVLATAEGSPGRSTRARELACWCLVPVLALVAARAR